VVTLVLGYAAGLGGMILVKGVFLKEDSSILDSWFIETVPGVSWA